MAQSKVALFDGSFTEYPGTIEQFKVIAPQPQPPTLTIEEEPQDKIALFDRSFTQYPCSIEQFEVTAPQPQPPTLTIEEQPAQFYRFRFESEIEKDSSRVGGLLLGRSSTDGNKSFMKVRVGGIDPAQHSQLQLTVCTVSAEDKAPHPYYLHGDNCKDGYFELTESVNVEAGKDPWEISFDRLAVICVSKKKEDIEKGMEARRKNVPPLPGCQESPSVEYTSSSLGRIRLAIALSFTDKSGHNWPFVPVFTDEIRCDKTKKNIEISSLNPAEVPMNGDCMIGIHTTTVNSGIQKSDVKVHFTRYNEDNYYTGVARTVFVQDVVEIKKHLLVVKAPDMRNQSQNDRLKCAVTVLSNGFESEELRIVFLRRESRFGNSLKRRFPD